MLGSPAHGQFESPVEASANPADVLAEPNATAVDSMIFDHQSIFGKATSLNGTAFVNAQVSVQWLLTRRLLLFVDGSSAIEIEPRIIWLLPKDLFAECRPGPIMSSGPL